MIGVDCCDNPRPETYEVEAPRNGLAQINRCQDCGALERTWLRPMDPPPPPKPPPATKQWQRDQAADDWFILEYRHQQPTSDNSGRWP